MVMNWIATIATPGFLSLLQVTFWKNVSGVYTADPRQVPEAFPVNSMCLGCGFRQALFGINTHVVYSNFLRYNMRKWPSGKQPHNYGTSPFLLGKSTISMAMFNSYVAVYQRVHDQRLDFRALDFWRNLINWCHWFRQRFLEATWSCNRITSKPCKTLRSHSKVWESLKKSRIDGRRCEVMGNSYMNSYHVPTRMLSERELYTVIMSWRTLKA